MLWISRKKRQCVVVVLLPPLTLLVSAPQLLHWKLRNVCGQDYRGQVAEGIWHPTKAWFWRYGLWLRLVFLRGGAGSSWALLSSQGVHTMISHFPPSPHRIRHRVGLVATYREQLWCDCYHVITMHLFTYRRWLLLAEVGHTCRRAVKHCFVKSSAFSDEIRFMASL